MKYRDRRKKNRTSGVIAIRVVVVVSKSTALVRLSVSQVCACALATRARDARVPLCVSLFVLCRCPRVLSCFVRPEYSMSRVLIVKKT